MKDLTQWEILALTIAMDYTLVVRQSTMGMNIEYILAG